MMLYSFTIAALCIYRLLKFQETLVFPIACFFRTVLKKQPDRVSGWSLMTYGSRFDPLIESKYVGDETLIIDNVVLYTRYYSDEK